MRRDDAATENCRLQCRPNVNETVMCSTVSENRTVTLTCQSCAVAVSSRWLGRRSKNYVGQQSPKGLIIAPDPTQLDEADWLSVVTQFSIPMSCHYFIANY